MDGTVAQGCSGLALCEDFESYTPGSSPGAPLWSLIDGSNCGGAAAYSVVVDTSQSPGGQAHSGTKSVKAFGGDSCGPVITNTTAFSKLQGGEVYGRFYMRLSTATPYDHAAFALLGFSADAGPLGNYQADYLQIATQPVSAQPILLWNYSDHTLPQPDTTGAAMTTYPAVNTWTCIEFHTSANTGGVEAWVNSAAISGMTYIPGTTATNSDNQPWQTNRPTPLKLASFGVGLVDFHNTMTTVWFDDVALSSTRVGCQ
jgi:hypothetical protein